MKEISERRRKFLLGGKYSEGKIIEALIRANKGNTTPNLELFFKSKKDTLSDLVDYMQTYMGDFARAVLEFDIDMLIERFLKEAEIDASYEMLQDSNYADVCQEETDMLIDGSSVMVTNNNSIDATDEIVDAKLIRM